MSNTLVEHLGRRVAQGAPRPKPLFRFAVVLALGVGVVSCDKPGPEKTGTAAANASSQPLGAAVATPSASEKTPASAAAPSASAAEKPTGDAAFVGTWEGRYDAKKGDVGMPPRVEDKVRSKDDGKTAIGPGTLSLVIAENMEVDGTSDGALGNAKIHGKVDGDEVRAVFNPVDVQDKRGMYGMVSGKRKDDRIEARIRVASGDVTIVREADIVLKRKPPP